MPSTSTTSYSPSALPSTAAASTASSTGYGSSLGSTSDLWGADGYGSSASTRSATGDSSSASSYQPTSAYVPPSDGFDTPLWRSIASHD